jgi:hypothetical protein
LEKADILCFFNLSFDIIIILTLVAPKVVHYFPEHMELNIN